MSTRHRLAAALATLALGACGTMHDMHDGRAGYGMHDAADGRGMHKEKSGPALVREGVLTDAAGRTLYTFDRDPSDGSRSVCHDQCAANWPPLLATAGDQPSGAWTRVARDDGALQWAYKGKPLYRWIKDAKPGDRTGDGVNGVWRTARP